MAKSMSLNAASGVSGMLKDGHKTFSGLFFDFVFLNFSIYFVFLVN